MRFLLASSLAALTLFSRAFALPQEKVIDPVWDDAEDVVPHTTFNGMSVPPQMEIEGDKFDDVTKKGYWFVKHYSPNCKHCRDFAPVWQTYHEFLFTSNPVIPATDTTSPRDFTSFYDFHLASINCIAWGNTCEKHEINMYPIMVLYKDGKEIGRYHGAKTMKGLSEWVEPELEKIVPGSRPRSVILPEIGASSVAVSEAQTVEKASAVKDAAAPKADAVLPKAGASTPKADAAPVKDAIPKADATPKKAEAVPTKAKATPVAAQSSAPLQATRVSEASLVPAPIKDTAPVPLNTHNPSGSSISLSAEDFQKFVLLTQDPWLIKFYAPWCHHCQAMAPVWTELGKESKHKMNIGEVNCEVETRLCKDIGVHSYPTILLFKGGERVAYEGLRGLGDFVTYTDKAIQAFEGVQDVDEAQFEALEQKEEVIFLYFYDHATVSEDFRALERLLLGLVGHARLVKTNSKALTDRYKITTWPRLLVSRDGRPTYYTPLAPRDMREYNLVMNWMRSVWLPIVPELTVHNANDIMDGKLVVLGILNRQRPDEFKSGRKEIKSAAMEWMDKEIQMFQLERQELRDAKQLRIEEADDRDDQRARAAAKNIRIDMSLSDRRQVGFAWVDGVFWERWLRSTYGIDVKDGERVVINDQDNRRYWDTTITGNYIIPSRVSILETIPKVVANPPKIKPKLTISSFEKVFFDMRGVAVQHTHLTMGFFVLVLAAFALWTRSRLRSRRGGFFRLDEKDGILGGNGGGKTD